MLKKKIIASSIENLTDARYFAGWMVDYFVFNIDKNSKYHITPQDIGTFQSWVEGPRYLLEMTTDQLEYAEKLLVDLNCYGILINERDLDSVRDSEIPYVVKLSLESFEQLLLDNRLPSVVIITDIVSMSEAMQVLNNLTFSCEVYLELNHEKLNDKEILDPGTSGYMVHGSPEEKVGFKSYDELDEIFEALQDF